MSERTSTGSDTGGGYGKKPIRRRALLIGGGAALLGGLGYGAAVGFEHLWWRLPGVERPRKEGVTDHRGAEWTAADEANYRRADRPDDYSIDRVVVHVTQSTYPVALQIFQDPERQVSAHYVVRSRDGHVTQLVRELDVAYHAGNRSYNERSIGIEHEGFVDQPQRWFTEAMYASSAKLCAGICTRYDIPVDRQHIIAHHEVPGSDHTDPGRHWDWDRYLRLVRTAKAAPS